MPKSTTPLFKYVVTSGPFAKITSTESPNGMINLRALLRNGSQSIPQDSKRGIKSFSTRPFVKAIRNLPLSWALLSPCISTSVRTSMLKAIPTDGIGVPSNPDKSPS